MLAKNLAVLNPSCDSASSKLLHDLLSDCDPSSIAVRFYDSLDGDILELTHEKLSQLSDHYAAILLEHNVTSSIVPVILPQGPQLYISLLAILKSGNTYCPILPGTNHDRIEFICKDVNATVCFLPDNQNVVEGVTPLHIDLDTQCSRQCFEALQSKKVATSSASYCMYTSGSTGEPKGVLISHSSACTAILAHESLFSDNKGKSLLQFANSTFDISIFEIFSAWTWNMTLISAHHSLLLNNLSELIFESRVSYIELTPSMANLIPDQDDPLMRHVNTLITIGEPITRQIIEGWHGKLVNAYGPSKTF